MSASPSGATARLWIGPAGWSYADWRGPFYPATGGGPPLAYLARYFNAVEVNSSFYRTPAPRTTAGWLQLVPRDFRFAFKLHQAFTHVRTQFPPRRDVDAFCAALQPPRESGQLGPLLMQFPGSFRFAADSVAWLRRLADAFAAYPRFIELRHASWDTPAARAAVLAAGGWCNIDQPALRDCLRPTAIVSGRSAYVRLHGRNAAHWFAQNSQPWERYNYLYSTAELRDWATRIAALRRDADDIFVFANNHYRGQAPANALELRAILEAGRVAVPDELLRAFPHLATIAVPPRQPGLFDQL
ncbi:MAG: DUF72 domain-containing protein [Phycisphaerae bacterium]